MTHEPKRGYRKFGNKLQCPRCGRIGGKELFYGNNVSQCRPCREKKAERRKVKKRMANSQAVVAGTVELLKKVKESDSEDLQEIVRCLKEEFGGIEGYMKRFMTDFKKANGEGLSPLEAQLYKRNDFLVHKWHTSILNVIEAKEKNAIERTGFENLTEEDLRALLLETALNCLGEDFALRDAWLNSMLENDPSFISELSRKVTEHSHLLKNAGVIEHDGDT